MTFANVGFLVDYLEFRGLNQSKPVLAAVRLDNVLAVSSPNVGMSGPSALYTARRLQVVRSSYSSIFSGCSRGNRILSNGSVLRATIKKSAVPN